MLWVPKLRDEIFAFAVGTCEGVEDTDNTTCEAIKILDTCKANDKCKWQGDPNVEKSKEWIQHNTMIFQIVLGSVSLLEIIVVLLTCWYRNKAKSRGHRGSYSGNYDNSAMDRMLMGGQQPERMVYNHGPGSVNSYNPPPNYGNSRTKNSRDRMRDKYGNHF